MFGLPNPWKYVSLGSGIALVLLGALTTLCWHKWGSWKDNAETLQRQADTVVIALKTASENPKVTWQTAAGQILALGDDKRQWRETSERQSDAINSMAESARLLRARADELRQIADAAKAQRSAAIRKLNDVATTPLERADCETLLKEADAALDAAYEAGL